MHLCISPHGWLFVETHRTTIALFLVLNLDDSVPSCPR